MTAAVRTRLLPRTEATTTVIAVLTLVAAVWRLYRFTQPGYLGSIIGYDDGVYFGASVQLVHGSLPYQDFIFVHPPLVPLLMTPFAALSSVTGTATALAIARVVTALVGVAAIPLLGLLLRHRGTSTVAIGCAILALHEDTVASGHSVFLEPYLVAFCLWGLVLVFDGDRFTDSSRRLLWGGILLGLGCAVKIFALAPILVLLAMSLRAPRRLARLAIGSVIGFAVPVLPFFLIAPLAFIHDVFVSQLIRTGARTGYSDRLSNLIGTNDLGDLPHASVFAMSAVLFGIVVVGYVVAWREHRPTQLEIFTVAASAAIAVMFLVAVQFYWHYAGFFAPFAAALVALPTAGLARRRKTMTAWAIAMALVVGLLATGSADQFDSVSVDSVPTAAIHLHIPANACVVTNTVSLTLAADRFSTSSGCPVFVDGLGTDIVLADGRLGRAAETHPRSRRAWFRAFGNAKYLLLDRNLLIFAPWHDGLLQYVDEHFRRLPVPGDDIEVYERRTLPQ